MYLIKQMFNFIENLDNLYIYQGINDKWQLNQIIKIRSRKSLFEQIKKIPFRLDYAIIELNQPYRNSFYYCYPHIKVVIDKDELITLFNASINQSIEAYEEVAVSLEQRDIPIGLNRDWRYFIQDFYKMPSKEEAIKCYELWQTYLPINDKKVGKFIRIMEFYFDEIINYFEAPQI